MFHIGALVFLVAYPFMMIDEWRTFLGRFIFWGGWLGAVVASAAAVTMVASSVMRMLALGRIRVRGFLLCGGCGHDLRGVESEHCPECGASASADLRQSFWKRYIRFHAPMYDWERSEKRPQWMARRASLIVLVMIVVWVSSFVGFAFIWRFEPVPGVAVAVAFVFMMQWSLRLVAAGWSRRLCKRLIRESGMVCTKCGGCVAVTDSGAKCQRCGMSLVSADLVATWERSRPPCWDLEMAPH